MSAAPLRRGPTREALAECILVGIVAVGAAVPWLAFAFGPVDPHNFFFGSKPAGVHILGVPIPPSGGPIGYVGTAVSLSGVLVAIVFVKPTITWPPALAATFALIMAAFVGVFAAIYVQLSHDSSGACLGGRITKLDAVYFTLGTLSTAGTGELTAVSQQCRGIVSVQLVAGFVLVTVAIAGLVSRLLAD
jgi:hypothetical protein